MQERPRIKLILSPLDKTLERISKCLLVFTWALALYALSQSPDVIPIHFNGAGKPDDYGSKFTLLLLPIIATILELAIGSLNLYPHIFNYMTTITEQNAERQYTIATRMLRWVKLGIAIIFMLIVLLNYLTIIGLTDGPGWWFLPLVFALVLLPAIVGIWQSLKKPNDAG